MTKSWKRIAAKWLVLGESYNRPETMRLALSRQVTIKAEWCKERVIARISLGSCTAMHSDSLSLGLRENDGYSERSHGQWTIQVDPEVREGEI